MKIRMNNNPPRRDPSKIVHPSGDDGGDGMAWVPDESPHVSGKGTHCVMCAAEIKVMAFKTTGVCSEACRKFRAGDISREEYDKIKSRVK